MKLRVLHLPLACALIICSPVLAQDGQGTELEALREEIRQMRSEYETRIADLEARLDAAENRESASPVAAAAPADPPAPKRESPVTYSSPQTVSVARDSSFNPAIGVTFQGQAWSYEHDPEDYLIPGFPLGGEAGPAPEGLSLAETEITVASSERVGRNGRPSFV